MMFIIVSKDFGTSMEASLFSSQLVADRCGFQPLVKARENAFVVCRQFRMEDPDDASLYEDDLRGIDDGEEHLSWLLMEREK